MPRFRGRSYQIFRPLILSLSLYSQFFSSLFVHRFRFYRLDKSTWHACMHAMCHPHGMHAPFHVSPTWHACIMPRVMHMACRHHACHPHGMHASCHVSPTWHACIMPCVTYPFGFPFTPKFVKNPTIPEFNEIHLCN